MGSLSTKISRIDFSVIVTTYNSSEYVLETLESIGNQSFRNYEVLIIDDGSTDNTVDVVSELIVDNKKWRLYKNERNFGVAYSRNKGFGISKGKYIAIVDSDDIWLPNKLAVQYRILEENQVDFCYSSYSYIDEKSKPIDFIYKTQEKADYESLLKNNYIGCSTVAFKADISNSLKMDRRIAHEDYYFWLTILKNGYSAQGISDDLVKYRLHSRGRSYNKIEAAKNKYLVLRKYEKLGFLRTLLIFISYSFNALFKFSIINIKRYMRK